MRRARNARRASTAHGRQRLKKRPVIDEVRANRARKKSAASRAITHSYSPSILIIGRRAEVVHSNVKRALARELSSLGLIKKRNNHRCDRGRAVALSENATSRDDAPRDRVN